MVVDAIKRKENLLPVIVGLVFSLIYLVLPIQYLALASVGIIGLVSFLYNINIGIMVGLFIYPFIPDTGIIYYFILLVMIFIFHHFFKSRDNLEGNKVEIPMVIYGILIIIGTFTSINPSGSFRDFTIHMVSLSLVVVMVNSVKTMKELNRLITVLVFSATIVALIGLYQYVVGVDIDAAWIDVANNPDIKARVFSVFGNPNVLAEYLIMMIPLSISLMWYSKKLYKKVLFLGTSLVLILAIVLTMSRGGWLGFAFSALVFILLVDKRFLLSIIPITLAGVYLLPQTYLNRILSIGNFNDSSNAYRLKMWEITMEIIGDYPLAGVGFGHLPFKQTFETYIRTMPTYHAHNTFLEIAAELGIPGLIAFVILIFVVFKYSIKELIKKEHTYISIISAGVLSGLAGVLAHGAVENVLYLTRIIFSFWMLIGLLLVLLLLNKQVKEPS